MNFIDLINFWTTANVMKLLLALLIFMVLWTMITMHRNPEDSFDIKDLVSTEDKIDEKKFTRFGAWVISTWGFVYLIVNNPTNFPEWYFIGYMGAWVANAIFDKRFNSDHNRSSSDQMPPIRRPRLSAPADSDYMPPRA